MTSSKLRVITERFVVAPPTGARVRTRLKVGVEDAAVLMALGRHLGSLAGTDLAQRCREGKLDAKERAESRRERKRSLTQESSSRWAGAITRSSEDVWQLGWRNMLAQRRSLQVRVRVIRRRLEMPVGEGRGRVRGYSTRSEHFEKRRRLQLLEARLVDVERRLEQGRASVCRGGGGLAKARHHLDAAGLTKAQWRERWDAERLFITADGEAAQLLGNLTIRWHPDEESLEFRLPRPLEHLANQPAGRYRLTCPVTFSYRGDEVAAQVATGAVRYDITFDAKKHRWYLDASWRFDVEAPPSLDELKREPVLAVDLNHGHLAACVLDQSGNPIGRPFTVAVELVGLAASTRDGRLRAAISDLITTAKTSGCRAIIVEDLDFVEGREEGREHSGRLPSRGRRGKSFRRLVAGLPTAKFRDRLVQMATSAGLAVIAVDPAYTSRWGAQHWLASLREISPVATGHHAAALVIGRRGLGHRARRRGGCDLSRAAHRDERATNSAVPCGVSPSREPEHREADGRSRMRQRTRTGERPSPATRPPKTVRGRPKPAVLSATS